MHIVRLLLINQRIVQVCLCIAAIIAIFGGALQMYRGQPETSAHLDNIHRLMAGVYFSMGIISLWASITVKKQGTLVYLLALGIFLAGIGRLISIYHVGLPAPSVVWLSYLLPELILPIVMTISHHQSTKTWK